MKKYILIFFSLCTICAKGEGSEYIRLLQDIIHGSAAEKELDESFTADSLGFRRGLNPADPRFEIAYFFRNSFEATLSADLDMPSLYHQRNVLSKLNTQKAEAGYHQRYLTLMADLSDDYIELIYHSRLEQFLDKVSISDSIIPFQESLKKALDNGDITALDYADLQMVSITLSDALSESRRQKKMLTDRIRMYNPQFTLKDISFPKFDFGDMTSETFVQRAIEYNPETTIWETDSLAGERELKLAKWEWAPKIVLGARLDMDENSNFAPAALGGISIPLWENRGNIRHAKAKISSAKAEREKREIELHTELEKLYTQYSTSGSMIQGWDCYDADTHAQLLQKAYHAGKLTSSEFFLQFAKVLENAVRILALEYEHASCAARMTLLLNVNDL